MSDLVVIENVNPVVLFAKGGSDSILEQIRKEVKSFVPDLTTEAGRKHIASLAYKISRSKTALDVMGKTLVAGKKEEISQVDAERKRMRDVLDGLKDEVRKPLTDWENEESERLQGCRDTIDGYEILARECEASWQTHPIAVMKDYISNIQSSECDWKEFKAKANNVKTASIIRIEDCIAKRTKYDAEQAELAALRKKQEEQAQRARDAEIAKAASDKAEAEAKKKLDKESEARKKAEDDRKEAIEQANHARNAQEAAELKASIQKEKAKERLAAAKKLATKLERDRAATAKKKSDEETAKRQANINHSQTVHKEAAEALCKFYGMKYDDALPIIQAISMGKIPHVKIEY